MINVTDEQVSAALSKWYPGMWPDDRMFNDPTFRQYVTDKMRSAIVEAIAIGINKQNGY